ncbi:hypothetical protein [Paenibacillus maysiensis]|uniref:hypothetical protein n=1 Tax=Paenibacillus maysiensis TaxID=1155954 RepID=UPI00046ECFDB|nr:hypothetical protein [Paenibacillus maysiensis]
MNEEKHPYETHLLELKKELDEKASQRQSQLDDMSKEEVRLQVYRDVVSHSKMLAQSAGGTNLQNKMEENFKKAEEELIHLQRKKVKFQQESDSEHQELTMLRHSVDELLKRYQ